ncbi:nucleotidyltransferase domain-containing protein [Blastococcus sp. SYSU D00695]
MNAPGPAPDLDLAPARRAAVAAAVLRALAAAVPGSRAELRGSLATGRADRYSDVDVLWVVPDGPFAGAVAGLPGVLACVGPLAALRTDPDLAQHPRRRVLFARFAHLPLFWRVDLDVRAVSAGTGEGPAPEDPRWRGEDRDAPAGALANAVAALRAELRGRPAEADGLLRRAALRLGTVLADGATADRVVALAAAAAAAEPDLAAEVTALARALDGPP